MKPGDSILLPARDYDLTATLSSGQVFNWEQNKDGWTGVVAGHWVHLKETTSGIQAKAAAPQSDWTWLTTFLQTDVDLAKILASFPAEDRHLQAAVGACRGLRLLRQDPWECLASFILSSTKQIVQIRQIVRQLCERYGEAVATKLAGAQAYAFPTAAKIAALSETELRACKMGFRAPYLLAAAQRVAAGEINLGLLAHRKIGEAREILMQFAGVGEKIADCVLLFAYGFPDAFPVDVWVQRVLTEYYFRNRRVRPDRLRRFITTHFGPNSGYCQQYLFHHIRLRSGKKLSAPRD
ncbi:MAG: DNA glycosylase [Verrucomicrobiota bacterium]